MLDLIPMFDDYSHPQLNRLIKEKALRCPDCGAHQTSLIFMSEQRIMKPRYVVACTECKCKGPFGNNLFDAVKQWNKGEPWWKTGFIGGLFFSRKAKKA